jgi:hypothetical protein
MYASNDKLIKVYAYIQRMAARAYPNDIQAAAEIADDCLDRFMRLHHTKADMVNYHAWIGRSISGLKKNLERARRHELSLDDDELIFDKLANLAPQQEIYCDAQTLKKLADRLPERERWAFEILADGGTVKDVMDEMHVGPREALALLHQVRIKLTDYSTPTRRAA